MNLREIIYKIVCAPTNHVYLVSDDGEDKVSKLTAIERLTALPECDKWKFRYNNSFNNGLTPTIYINC